MDRRMKSLWYNINIIANYLCRPCLITQTFSLAVLLLLLFFSFVCLFFLIPYDILESFPQNTHKHQLLLIRACLGAESIPSIGDLHITSHILTRNSAQMHHLNHRRNSSIYGLHLVTSHLLLMFDDLISLNALLVLYFSRFFRNWPRFMASTNRVLPVWNFCWSFHGRLVPLTLGHHNCHSRSTN